LGEFQKNLFLHQSSKIEIGKLESECQSLQNVLKIEIEKKAERKILSKLVAEILSSSTYVPKQVHNKKVTQILNNITSLLTAQQLKRDLLITQQTQLLTLLTISRATTATLSGNDIDTSIQASNASAVRVGGRDEGRNSNSNSQNKQLGSNSGDINNDGDKNNGSDHSIELIKSNALLIQDTPHEELLSIFSKLLQKQKNVQNEQQIIIDEKKKEFFPPEQPRKRTLTQMKNSDQVSDEVESISTIVPPGFVIPLNPKSLSNDDF